MASVLVKGMEMPARCFDCGFCDYECAYCLADVEERNVLEFLQTRPDWCPLVEVPPHGRLGDLDALALAMMDAKDADQALAMVDDAPTIIPSDEEAAMMIEINVYDGRVEIGSGCLTDQCIHDVDVHQDYRRRGIGTKIINALRILGGTWLWVDTEDVGVMQFYESCGFEVEELIDGERFAVMRIPADREEDGADA